MTRNIKLGEIGDFMGEQVQELVKITTLEWEARVKEQTPVPDRVQEGSGMLGKAKLSPMKEW
jgi:hypothetical protein